MNGGMHDPSEAVQGANPIPVSSINRTRVVDHWGTPSMRSLLIKSAIVALGALSFAGAASAQSPWSGRPGGSYGGGSGYGQPAYRGPAPGVVAPRPPVLPPPVYVGGPPSPHVVPPHQGPGYHPRFGGPAPWQYRKWRRWFGPRHY
jgi:hypothetical protein